MPQKTEIEAAPEIETSTPASGVSDHSAAPPPRSASPAAARRPIPGWLILGAVVVIVVVGIFVWNYFAM